MTKLITTAAPSLLLEGGPLVATRSPKRRALREPELYTVTIRTTCRACAMAIAGHAPRLRTIRAVFVTEQEGEHTWTIHANSGMARIHDGSPLACPEHGVVMDLSRNPGEP